MECVQSLTELADLGICRAALACGVFDGLHLGHRRIIEALHEEARRTRAAPVAITFWPHPRVLHSPESHPGLLLSAAHRLELLRALDLAATVVLPFTRELSALSPKSFVADVLLGSRTTVTALCVGESWRFGHRASGDAALLSLLARGCGVRVRAVPELTQDGQVISSTRIRDALQKGDLERCHQLLGRNFSIYGPVGRGRGIGASELHCPTANVVPDNELFPPPGIYAAQARVGDVWHPGAGAPPSLPGVCYLGSCPTFAPKSEAQGLEMHLFDFAEDLYGRMMEVEFLTRLRGDRRFAGPEELARQIALDIEAARAVHRALKSAPSAQ